MKPPSQLGTTRRRRVDWPVILGPEAPVPHVMKQARQGTLDDLLAAFDEILALEDPDAILKRAVEIGQQRVGLGRVAIFLLDRQRNVMLGTWGTDLRGRLVDEHHIMYEVSETDREAFRRSEHDGAHFTVFENCPIVEHGTGETHVAGRGWVACTPIRSARAPIGILFNDAGLSGRPVDEVKQAHAALLCSLLGTVLDPVRGLLVNGLGMGGLGLKNPSHDRLVSAAVEMLDKDPTMGGKQIAAKLDISLSRLARVFKAQLGTSLVAYRNRLRMERFSSLVEQGHTNLLGAALAAGFGSYAQFHRVFRALRRGTPRELLRAKVC
jgi:AraC-like DNA-binding protein